MKFVKYLSLSSIIVAVAFCNVSCNSQQDKKEVYNFTQEEQDAIVKDLEDNCLDKSHCDDFLIKISSTERDGRVNVTFVCTGQDFLQEQNQIVTMNRTIARVHNFANDDELYNKIHSYQFAYWLNSYNLDSFAGEYFAFPPKDFIEYQKDYKKYSKKTK